MCWTVNSVSAVDLHSFEELMRFKEPTWCMCFLVLTFVHVLCGYCCGICHSTLVIDCLGLGPRLEEGKTGGKTCAKMEDFGLLASSVLCFWSVFSVLHVSAGETLGLSKLSCFHQ